ncbi:MAG: BLUF domain-containing protein [Ramlibacter sp.]|nr:BLUF domain-containing protein [Ramlibacter sp.]
MSQLYTLVYVSSVLEPFTDEELELLLASAREFNRSQQVTGMLVYGGGNFMQVLEGTEPALAAVLQRVRASRRHRGILELIHDPIAQREFGNWDMAFRRLETEAFLRLTQHEAPSKILLRGFIETLR